MILIKLNSETITNELLAALAGTVITATEHDSLNRKGLSEHLAVLIIRTEGLEQAIKVQLVEGWCADDDWRMEEAECVARRLVESVKRYATGDLAECILKSDRDLAKRKLAFLKRMHRQVKAIVKKFSQK